jgi:hypothetical protein
MTRILLILLATLAVLLTSAASTEAAPTVEQNLQLAAQAFPDSPCAGHLQIVWWTDRQADYPTPEQIRRPDLASISESFDEYALGVVLYDDGATVLNSCDLGVRRSLMADDPIRLCDVIVHGAGHLAGVRHTHDGSVMDLNGPGYPACRTLRDRIKASVAALIPDPMPLVVCGRWEGRVLPCRVEWVDLRHRARVTWFRARTRGDAYAIRRVRSPR